MKKGMIFFAVILLLIFPTVNAFPLNPHINEEKTIMQCSMDGKCFEKEMEISTIQKLIDMGASHMSDFLTIYDKTKSEKEVAHAFKNIQPFFQALIDNDLTDKNLDEINILFYQIRMKIQTPKSINIPKALDGPQPTGLWNGVPVPMWFNGLCGIFDVGTCAGFAGGTHTIIPTIGLDVFITYAFQGTSITVGLTGGTLAVAAFQVLFGFVGVLLATPLIMIGPYFMTGMSGAVFGAGL